MSRSCLLSLILLQLLIREAITKAFGLCFELIWESDNVIHTITIDLRLIIHFFFTLLTERDSSLLEICLCFLWSRPNLRIYQWSIIHIYTHIYMIEWTTLCIRKLQLLLYVLPILLLLIFFLISQGSRRHCKDRATMSISLSDSYKRVSHNNSNPFVCTPLSVTLVYPSTDRLTY